MALILCSFANQEFCRAQQFQIRFSRILGFKTVLAWNNTDYDLNFSSKNDETLKLERGAGYWLWKPYFILKTCELALENDTILYLDSGALPKMQSKYFERIARDGKIHLWSLSSKNEPNYLWIDQKVADLFGVASDELSGTHFWAGAILFQNSTQNRELFARWLSICENPHLLRPDSFPNYEPSPRCIWHRHDQSLLNLILLRHKRAFTLHRFRKKFKLTIERGLPFLVHRKDYISSFYSLILFILLRQVKRTMLKLLPKYFRFLIQVKLSTTHKKNTVSGREFRRINQVLEEDY